MSDSFSLPEKEQLCQKNAETTKAEYSGMERASGQTENICSDTLTALGKDIQCIVGSW